MESPIQTTRDMYPTQEAYDNRPRAGVILLNAAGHVLVLRDIKSHKWGFPKGAMELQDGMRLRHTAIREAAEETGLHEGIDFELTAAPFHTIHGQSYYIGILSQGAASRIQIQAEEITDYTWLDPQKPALQFRDMNIGVRSFLKKVA